MRVTAERYGTTIVIRNVPPTFARRAPGLLLHPSASHPFRLHVFGHITNVAAIEHDLASQKGAVVVGAQLGASRHHPCARLDCSSVLPERPEVVLRNPIRVDTTILLVDQHEMVRLLHQQHAMSDRFIAHLLARIIRVEEDLVDQLFSSSEKRLARKLLLLARYGEPDKPLRTVPAISQETLAEMVGTTRSRVNFFMKKFQRLGFIDYKDGLRVHNSLLAVVLHD